LREELAIAFLEPVFDHEPVEKVEKDLWLLSIAAGQPTRLVLAEVGESKPDR
jgi:hypothetical protein